MFVVTTKAESADFFEYLEREAKLIDKEQFAFSSYLIAGEVFSRYAIYYLREKNIESLYQRNLLLEEERSDFITYISQIKMTEIFEQVKEIFSTYFEQNCDVHFEGFINFRLQKANRLMEKTLEEAYSEFSIHEDESATLLSLKQFLEAQSTGIGDLKMIVEDSRTIILEGEGMVFLEEQVTMQNKGEDNVLSHIILLSPKRLFVYDPKDLLSKETVIILSRLFEERVRFFRERHTGN